MRIIRGYVGQTLAEMDTEHFIIDSMIGPNSSGNVTIKASDFMKLLNSEKSLCPLPNSGRLDLEYLAGTTVIDLTPAGIGDIEYPASGRIAIAKEVFDFTRVSDQITLGAAMADDHKQGEIVQLTKLYNQQKSSEITADLIENFSPLDASYTDLPAWNEIVDTFADLLYTREIVKPTPTRTLINELINQAGLVVFGNTRTQQVSFDVLRATPSTGDLITGEKILKGSFSQKDQPKKRFSQIVVYYDKRDDFASDEPENYYSAAVYVVPDDQYPTPNTLRIFSKWIRSESLSIAADVAVRAAARYRFPPLSLGFSMTPENNRGVGQIVTIEHHSIETATGAQGRLDAIITGVTNSVDDNKFIAEEYNIDADLLSGDRVIQYDTDKNNINLRDEYDARFGSIDESPGAPAIIFRIMGGVVIGSGSTSNTSLTSGDWPVGVEPILEIRSGGYIAGAGGNGLPDQNGGFGGKAVDISVPITIDNEGTIGGGGGAGGGVYYSPIVGTDLYGRGGGGAGRIAGTGGSFSGGGGEGPAVPATLDTGGEGQQFTGFTFAGDGGDLGQDGQDGTGGKTGGSAGVAIDGVSNVTFTSIGTILGDQIG